MINLEQVVRELMRDVGKTLRPLGFKGSVSQWTRVTPDGMAVVRRWNHKFHARGHEVWRFGLNGDSVPAEWCRFENWQRRNWGWTPLPIERIGGPEIVDIGFSEPGPRRTSVFDIRRVEYGPPPLVLDEDIEYAREHVPGYAEGVAREAMRFVVPGCYLEKLLAIRDKNIRDWQAIIVLLAGQGRSDELDDAIEALGVLIGDPADRTFLGPLVDYTRDRLAGRA